MISYAAKASLSETNGASLNQGYPSGIVAGDLLIIQAISLNVSGGVGSVGAIIAPPEWNVISGGQFRDITPQLVGSYYCFYKIADGTESGVVALSRTGTTGGATPFASQMYRFNGGTKAKFGQTINVNGDGSTTITWLGLGGPVNRTDIALVGQVGANPGPPFGFTADASDNSSSSPSLYLECSTLEAATGSIDISGPFGSPDGWATLLTSFYEASGGFFINDH